MYDAEAKKYEVEFQSLNDKKAAPVKISMATTVSKDDVGDWKNLISGNNGVTVQASHR